jgi:hypothetical protein
MCTLAGSVVAIMIVRRREVEERRKRISKIQD